VTAHEAMVQSLAAASEKLKKLRDELAEFGRNDLADLAFFAGVDVMRALGKAVIAQSQARMEGAAS
jgi:phosphoglycerate-specific signal transduction histidine kinase